MKNAIVGLLVGTLGIVSSAFGANWELVRNTEEMVDYIDTASITKNGDITTVWELRSYYTSTLKIPDIPEHRSAIHHREYDCNNRKTRIIYLAMYPDAMGQGKAVMAGTMNSKWSPIMPGSVGEILLKAACNR